MKLIGLAAALLFNGDALARAELNEARYVKALFDQGILKTTVFQAPPGTPPRFEVTKEASKTLNPAYAFAPAASGNPSTLTHQACYGNWLSQADFNNLYSTTATASAATCSKVQTTYRFVDYDYTNNKVVVEIHEQTHPRITDKLDFSRALLNVTPIIVPYNPPPATADDTKGLRFERVVRAPDGSYFVAATLWTKYGYDVGHVIKFSSNFGLDTTFGGTGIVKLELPGTPFTIGSRTYMKEVVNANDIRIQPDGKVLVLVSNNYWVGPNNWAQQNVVRLNLDGTIDATFGRNGWGYLGSSQGNARRFAFQPDGKFLFIDDHWISRFNADGTVDVGFGTGGKIQHRKDPPNGFCCGGRGGYPLSALDQLGILPDGRILISATGFYNGPPNDFDQVNPFLVSRLSAAGAPDNGFGNTSWLEWEAVPSNACTRGGILSESLGIYPYSPTPNPQNVIAIQVTFAATTLQEGPFGSGCNIGRYGATFVQVRENGTLNTSFGTSGKRVLAHNNVDYFMRTAHMGPNQYIYLSGGLTIQHPQGARSFAFINRMSPTGTFDGAFGSGTNPTISSMDPKYGALQTAYTMGFTDMEFDPDGNIVVILQDIKVEGPLNDLTFLPYDRLLRLDKNTGLVL